MQKNKDPPYKLTYQKPPEKGIQVEGEKDNIWQKSHHNTHTDKNTIQNITTKNPPPELHPHLHSHTPHHLQLHPGTAGTPRQGRSCCSLPQ